MLTVRIMLLLVLLVPAACGGDKPPAGEPLTQRQRDSAIAASGLPGARGIERATGASDSAAARNVRLDSLARSY